MNVVVNTSPLVALDRIGRYFALGCEVKGFGRGHMKRLKESVKKGVDVTVFGLMFGPLTSVEFVKCANCAIDK
jgi:hypothetical protein